MISEVTQELLLSLFDYDDSTGVVIRKKTTSPRAIKGMVITHKNKAGYVQVRLKGKLWMLHRLIWCMKTGKMPVKFIDHINGEKDDNRWCNLREADYYVNNQNRTRPDKDSATQLLGVTYDKQCGKYKVQLTLYGKKVVNKLFIDPLEAAAYYKTEKERICRDSVY